MLYFEARVWMAQFLYKKNAWQVIKSMKMYVFCTKKSYIFVRNRCIKTEQFQIFYYLSSEIIAQKNNASYSSLKVKLFFQLTFY